MYARAYRFFPLGIGFVASALEKNSIDYSFYDLHRDWMKPSTLVKKVKEEGAPDLFALTALLTSLPNSIEICKALKRHFPETKIVLGGKLAILDPEFIFRNVATDYIIRGEGEIAIIELIEMLQGKRSIDKVQGLAYKDETGNIRFNGEAALVENISDYYFPYRSIDMSRYVSRNTVQSPNLPSINMISSRGCPFACTFCNFSKGQYNCMRYYDIDVLSDIWDYLITNYGLEHITFNDDIFTVNKKRVKEVCGRLKEKNLAFSCSTRLDCLGEEMISILEDSDCRYLCIGIESPAPAVAKIIDKRIEFEKYQRNIDLLKKSRMTVNFGFMFGYCGETEETIRETREFVLKNNLIYSAFFATAFPQTKLYDMVRDRIPDEDKYLKKLATVDLSANYLINMTDIPKRKLYSLRDHLVADSVLNVMNIRIPGVTFLVRKLFVLYLIFMRRIGLKTAIFKRIFEFINIVIVKPMASSRKS